MAENSAVAKRQRCCLPPSPSRQVRAPDRVHAAVDAMKPAFPNSMLDRFRREPSSIQLGYRHDTMLPSGELGDDLIGVGAFWAHTHP
jgi:hypothetical protein